MSLVCDYCSTGDLYTYWMLTGQFKEREVQVFAAELGSALGLSLTHTHRYIHHTHTDILSQLVFA